MNIKRAVLLSQLLGAYRLCDIQFLRTELNYLNTTFSMLGYPDHLIQSVDAAAWSRFYACVDCRGGRVGGPGADTRVAFLRIFFNPAIPN